MLLKIFNFFYLARCLVTTKILFPEARLIRLPFHFRLSDKLVLSGFTSGVGLRIDFHSGDLKIGKRVQVNDYCHISCAKSLVIEDDVLIASRVYITDHDHGFSSLSERVIAEPLNCSPVFIGRNVWIGENVCILKGVHLGENCVVGAGSVVTTSFPRNSILAGNPARLIRDNS